MIAALAFLVILSAAFHIVTGGLLTELESRVVFSNTLVSSGGDSSFFVALALFAFVLVFVAAVIDRGILGSLVFSLSLYYFMLFLANLDVSLLESIKLGDHVLLLSTVLILTLVLYCVVGVAITRLRRRATGSHTRQPGTE